MLSFILIVIAFGFYYLAYKSPNTDLILYGTSGIFLILAAIAGFWGYGDIQTGETISYTYTTVNNETVIDTETKTPVYSENKIFTSYAPIILFLLGLYILIVLALEGAENKEKNDRSRRKKQS